MHPVLHQGTFLTTVPATFHADVSLWDYQGHTYVVKRIGAYYANFTPDDARELQTRLDTYYTRLRAAGVPVPPEFVTWVEGAMVMNVVTYAGVSVRERWHGEPAVLRELLALIGHVFVAPENAADRFVLRLSIEASPDNVTLAPDGQLTYIDFTPPLWIPQEPDRWAERLIPMNQRDEAPAWKAFRYHDRRGVLLTFLTKLWAAFPEHRTLLQQTLLAWLRQQREGRDLITYFTQAPATAIWRCVWQAYQVPDQATALVQVGHQLITAVPPAERDQLRLAAVLLMPVAPHLFADLQAYLVAQGVLSPSADLTAQTYLRQIFAYKSPRFHTDLQHHVAAILAWHGAHQADPAILREAWVFA